MLFTLGFLQLLWMAGLYFGSLLSLGNRFIVEIFFCFFGVGVQGSFGWLTLNSWMRLFCAFCSLRALICTMGSSDRFRRAERFLVLHFKMLVIAGPQRAYCFVGILPLIEVALTLAIWFVSIVTERANHARDHLKTEANLDKYDGWVLGPGSCCCFQAFNTGSSPWRCCLQPSRDS